MVLRGHYTAMETDGTDERVRCGVLLVRLRAIIDTLEAQNERTLHDQYGEIL